MYSTYSGISDGDLTLTGQIIDLQPRFQFPRQQHAVSRRELNKTFEIRPVRPRPRARPRRSCRGERHKPTGDDVFTSRGRNRTPRLDKPPLTMATTSIPGAGQRFHDQEDCQVLSQSTFERLLGSQPRADMSPTSVDVNVAQSQYLQDTYDYLFNRHIQTLNGVIDQHQQKLRIHCELEHEAALSNTDEDSESSGCSFTSSGVDVVIMCDGGHLSDSRGERRGQS